MRSIIYEERGEGKWIDRDLFGILNWREGWGLLWDCGLGLTGGLGLGLVCWFGQRQKQID